MESSSKKRKTTSSTPFDLAKTWILQNDGIIHSSLHLNVTRDLSTTTTIPTNTLILSIPSLCKINIHNTSTPFLDQMTTSTSFHNHTFHSPLNDIHLACCISRLLSFYTSSSASSTNSFFNPYLNTLPSNQAHNVLLRRWSDQDLQQLLQTSPLIKRATTQRLGIINDYAYLSTLWENIPSFETYDRALAIVTSRAFSKMGVQNSDALLPILDLIDHTRGLHASNIQKNIQYVLNLENGNIDVTTTKEILKNETIRNTYGSKGNGQLLSSYGFCIANNIEPDGSSNDVYELDINGVTIELRAGKKMYTFGPICKALDVLKGNDDTKGGDENEDEGGSGSGSGSGSGGNGDDMSDEQAFLDMMEGDGDMMSDFDMNSYMDNDTDNNTFENVDENDNEEDEKEIQEELDLLEKLLIILIDRIHGYILVPAINVKKEDDNGMKEKYARIIVLSDLYTLNMFQRSVQLILQKLTTRLAVVMSKKKKKKENKKTDGSLASVEVEEEVVTLYKFKEGFEDPLTNAISEQHAIELCAAFCQIRHPEY